MSSSAICLKQGAPFEAGLSFGRLRFPSLVASDANVVKRWSTCFAIGVGSLMIRPAYGPTAVRRPLSSAVMAMEL